MRKKLVCFMLILCMLSTMMLALPMSANATEDVASDAALFAGMPANVNYVRCWYDSNTITTQVNFNYLAQAGTLFVAVYDNNKLMAFGKKAIGIDETENIVEITGVNAKYKDYDVKVFYWGGNALIKPLSDYVEAEITSPIPTEGYGFIVSATTTGYKTYQVSILDSEGNIVMHNLEDEVRYASADNGIFMTDVDKSDVYADIKDLQGESWIRTAVTTDNIDNYARRIVSYKTNESGKIHELAFASPNATDNESGFTYNFYNIVENAYYDEQTNMFVNLATTNYVSDNPYFVNEDTIVFNLPMTSYVTKGDFSVTPVKSIANNSVCKAAFLPSGTSGVAKVMIVADKTRINKKTIDTPSNIQAANTGMKWESVFGYYDGDNYLSVFDEEVDTIATTYKVAQDARLFVNGQHLGYLVHNSYENMYGLMGEWCDELGLIYAPNKGTVTLLDTDRNNTYDCVFVETYVTEIIEDILDSVNSKKIYTTSESAIDLTNHIAGKEGYAYSITLDGEKATISDLKPNDVIAVSMSRNMKFVYIKASRQTVSGVVSSVASDYYIRDNKYVVNGTTYQVANMINPADSKLGNIKAGDEVIFFLDAYGDVALAKGTPMGGDNYAFIVGAGMETTVGDTTYLVRLLDKEGNIQTYELADRVRTNLYSADDIASEDAIDVYEHIADLGGDEWILKYISYSNIANYANRIVTFKTNSSGKITQIAFNAPGDKDSNYLTNNGDIAFNVRYNAKTYTFINKCAVDENTVVFNLPMYDKATRDDFSVETIETLTHDQEYAVAFLGIDEENVAKVMIVVDNENSVAQGTNLAVVTNVASSINEDYECIYDITFLQNGEEKTLSTTADVYSDIGYVLTAGVVFEYATDKNGNICAIALGSARDTVGDIDYVRGFGSAFDPNRNAKEQYVFGYVASKNKRGVITIGDSRDAHAIPADANFYLVDTTKVKNNITVSSYDGFTAINGDFDTGEVILDNDYCVFMKYYNDEITDVVIYKGLITHGDVEVYDMIYNNPDSDPDPEPVDVNYAFVVGAGMETTVGDATYLVRLLDKDGNIQTYELADKVRTNLDSADEIATIDAVDVYEHIADLGGDEWILKYISYFNIANYANRIVTFKTNSNGDISQIEFNAPGDYKSGYLTNNGDIAMGARYNAKTYTFINECAVDENTVVFNLPMHDKATRDDFTVETIETLTHDQDYAVAFLGIDKECVAKVMIVVDNEISVAQGSNLAVATKVMSAQNEDYDIVYQVTFLQNGEEKTLLTTADVYSDIGYDLTAGVVFEYATDKNGNICAIALGSARDTVGDIDYVRGFGSAFHPDRNAKEQYVFGYVYSKSSNRVITIGDYRDAHYIPADANFYLVDLAKLQNNIEISAYGELRAIKVKDGEVLVDNDYCVFMKYYNEEITDVIIYKGAIFKGYVNV